MATKTQNKESKFNITYEEKIITSEVEFENPIDISTVPVFQLDNVEVMWCSLGQKTPKMGHSITLIVDQDFIQKDRQFRNAIAQLRQQVDPNCETYKSQIKIIAQKDILEGKYPESMLGKGILNIFTTNAKMFDADEEKGKMLAKMEDAKSGNVVYKYFANVDRYTGKAIQPQVYKIENGQKVTSFISPKDNVEKPLFVGSKDIVNIKLRPYETHSDQQGYAVKYNLLEIEIVQTAFDRGIRTGGGSGKSKKVETAPDTVDLSSLAGMFAGSVTTTKVEQPKSEFKTEVKAELPTVESVTGVPGQEPEVKQVKAELPEKETSVDVTAPMQFDFSQLANIGDLGNLGE